MSAGYVRKHIGIKTEELAEYNYGISSRTWKGSYRLPSGYSLKVPRKYGAALAKLRLPEPRTSPSAPAASSVYGGVVYKVRRGDTLSRIAKKYGVSVSKLRQYNKLSSDLVKIGQLLVVRPKHTSAGAQNTSSLITSSTTTHVVRKGETLSTLARRYGTSVSKLRELNHLRSTNIKIGQKLRVRSSLSKAQASQTNKQSQRSSVVHTVRRGDTLWAISKKYKVSLTRLKQANGMRSNKLRAGQKLRIP